MNAGFGGKTTGQAQNTKYVGPQSLYIGSTNTGSKSSSIRIRFPLSRLIHTIFEIPKVMMFAQEMVLTLTMAPVSRVGYFGTTATSVKAATNQNLTATLQSLTLYHALENNLLLNQQAKADLQSGYRILFEHPTLYQTTLTGSLQVLQLKINRAIGLKLRRIYAGAIPNYSTSPTKDVQYDTSGPNKFASYYQEWASSRLTPFNIDITTCEDYMLLQEQLRGSSILSSYQFYHSCFMVYNSWEDVPRRIYERPPENASEGWDLTGGGDFYYYINYTANSSATSDQQNHFAYMIGERIAEITPVGIMVA